MGIGQPNALMVGSRGRFGLTVPSAPTISLGSSGVDIDGDAGATNYVWQRRVGKATLFSVLGNVSGDGTVTYPTDEGTYEFKGQSKTSDSWSQATQTVLTKYIGGSTRSIDERVMRNVADVLEAYSALKHYLIDREENRLSDPAGIKALPAGGRGYLCFEWGRVNEQPRAEEYNDSRRRLYVYLVRGEQAGKSGFAEMARDAELVAQALDADITRGDLVYDWEYRGCRNTGGMLPPPWRIVEMRFEYEVGRELGARIST